MIPLQGNGMEVAMWLDSYHQIPTDAQQGSVPTAEDVSWAESVQLGIEIEAQLNAGILEPTGSKE